MSRPPASPRALLMAIMAMAAGVSVDMPPELEQALQRRPDAPPNLAREEARRRRQAERLAAKRGVR